MDNTKIVKINVEQEMKKSFISYAMAVNVSRAIPDVRDGLKPVHRRILFAMNELGLENEKPTRKCARIVGDVLGKYHPHGDSAVYEALVRLAQDFSIRCPLVEGQGNFGSVDGDPAAAQRYTEAKLSKIASEMLRDIDKKTVNFYPNFDDTLMQPSVLPSRYPNLLVNGADGIAVGMATSIPPHNLGEVINATIATLDNPDIEIAELMEFVPAPDFPTGGLVLGRAAIRNAYLTGRGGCIIRAKTEVEENSNATRSRIIVHELPYQVNKAKLIETIADLVKDKKIEGISDIKDESDRKGMRIVIDIKRDANAQVVLNMLYKHTNLQISYSMIFLALIDGTPKILNIKQILEAYIKHQREVIVRRTEFDLEKAEEREHILKGIVIALNNVDEVIAIIRHSQDNVEAQTSLMERFELSEKQANAILEIKLRRLVSLEVEKIIEELQAIEKAVIMYHDILANSYRVDEIIKAELSEVKTRYNTARRSELSYDYSEINIADLIDREEIVISLTQDNYIKRIAASEYKAQHRGGVGVTAHKPKDNDFVKDVFTSSTHDDLFFFTDKGKVYILKGYEIPEASKTSRGRTVNNLLNVEQDESVTAILPITDEQERQGNLVLATKNGKIKKTDLKEFESIRRNGKIAIRLEDGDELISARLTLGDDELLMASSKGKCIRFHETAVRAMGRTAAGVKSMKIDKDDYIVDMSVIREGEEVLTITKNGYGKRTDASEYHTQGRAGKGVKAGNFNDKTGRIVSLKLINSDATDIIIITASGIIIRTAASEISKIGRAAQGVRIMKVGDNSEVVSVAITPKEELPETLAEGTIDADTAGIDIDTVITATDNE
ncbi:MAG: DNA gyrase subunit A [Clostridia bacterium]|nr:DNA gyrase subunit A [Clostridia bacterium]